MNRVKALHARVTFARLEYAEIYCENSTKEKYFLSEVDDVVKSFHENELKIPCNLISKPYYFYTTLSYQKAAKSMNSLRKVVV